MKRLGGKEEMSSQWFCMVIVLLTVWQATAIANCYMLYDENDVLVYASDDPPVDLSNADELQARFPGWRMVASEKFCPETIDVCRDAQKIRPFTAMVSDCPSLMRLLATETRQAREQEEKWEREAAARRAIINAAEALNRKPEEDKHPAIIPKATPSIPVVSNIVTVRHREHIQHEYTHDYSYRRSSGAVHVHGYYRRNGTYVHSYSRHSPRHRR